LVFIFYFQKSNLPNLPKKKKKLIGHGPAFFLFDLFSNVL